MASSDPKYDIIVLGATGYSASLCAEHITTHFSTDLKWAVAGRSAMKLEALVDELKRLNPDRRQPGIEVIQLTKEELEGLVRKTRVLINGIGPYHLHSSPVVEACANNGTHYLDFTTETMWVSDMVQRYHDKAKETGAIVSDSSPSDILAFLVASSMRKSHLSGTSEAICSAGTKLQGMSRGSFETVLTVMTHYGVFWFLSGNSWRLSPTQRPAHITSTTFLSRLLGYRRVPELGILTTFFNGLQNESVVHRSKGLMPDIYGPQFYYHEYQPVDSMFVAIGTNFVLKLGIFLLMFPPIHWLVKILFSSSLHAPGRESSRKAAEEERLDYRTIGTAYEGKGEEARAEFVYNGSMYYLSGLLGAEAAMVLVGEDCRAKEIGGGVLTPATLGLRFVERLRNAGVEINVKAAGESFVN
ncbi:MAG: hypothetical protein M1834_008770 [Cirrosporium novae-zelandiae]|nr:MAG: hypothetical protein M1834_008770 [Cirrosporium novae-zelandiae]